MNKFPDFSNYGYQIIRELGHNRAGGRVTYLGAEINTQRTVVVKQFQFARTGVNWSEYDAYEREIQVLRGLDHPSIPHYLDSFQTVAGFCMVQDYKNAPSLAMKTQWTPEQVKQIALSVLSILNYLQSQIPPVIHRDLKPENILVDEQLQVYLVDFGFARLGGGDIAVSSVIKGTLGFMPPEQMFNRQLSAASDLYSLGATLICLLTHTPSTEVGVLIDDIGRINFQQRIPELNPDFIRWLQKMVEPNVQNRYANANEALDALVPIKVLRPSPKTQVTKKVLPSLVGLTTLSFIVFTLVRVKPFFFNNIDVTVTTNLKSSTRLIRISKNPERIYFSVKLPDLPQGDYDSACQLFDESGILVGMGQSRLTLSAKEFSAWCWYDFNPNIDQSGDWTFKFFIDNEEVAQKTLHIVTP
jgi:serine/threonine protein kinase